MRIPVKPLSTNVLYRGRKYRTPQYRRYLRDLSLLLPTLQIPDGPLELKVIFGVSNVRCDTDNLLKSFIDGLMAKYHFDDSRIYSIWARKEIVGKGDEHIEFDLDRAR